MPDRVKQSVVILTSGHSDAYARMSKLQMTA